MQARIKIHKAWALGVALGDREEPGETASSGLRLERPRS
jgi:hypothetical protein